MKAQRWIEGDDELSTTEEAEVITSSIDEVIFRKLHGVTAKEANYDELAERLTEDEYKGILDVLKEMAAQHPDAMWFVRSWIVEAAPLD